MNIIQKQIVEIEMPMGQFEPQWQQRLSDFCENELMKSVEQEMEAYSGGQNIVVDKIELNIDLNELNNFEYNAALLIKNQLSQKLSQLFSESALLPEKQNQINGKREFSDVELLVWYLEKGHWPWWIQNVKIQDLFTKVFLELNSHNSTESKRIILKTLNQKNAFLRFFNQLETSKAISYSLILLSLNQNHKAIRILDIFIKYTLLKPHTLLEGSLAELTEKEGLSYFDLLIRSLNSILLELSPENIEFIKQEISKVDPNLEIAPTKEDSIKKVKKENTEVREGEIYISNAGLVLLQPFLESFLKEFKAADDHEILNPELATGLMQWLVTGKTVFEEADLVLNKILCGLDPSFPLAKDFELPEDLIAEGEKLLNAVINFWPLMQNTSIEGLREAFLMREGKIRLEGDLVTLFVESKPYDMLLAEIPWDFRTIGFSWMRKPLIVNWEHQ